jgi:hypothetical protein
MYSQPLGPAAAGVTGAGLAFTGLNIAWAIVLGLTLMGAGIVITRVVPRRKRHLA